jgi:mycofactocin system creatininase family protein
VTPADVLLGATTSPLVAQRASQARLTLVIPVGSCEQHGPHLPLDTDTRIAVALAATVSQQSGALVAPPIAIGASGEHAGFAGTLSIGTDALASVLAQCVWSMGPEFSRLLVVNGHGGNAEALAQARAMLGPASEWVAWYSVDGYSDAHGGESETSLGLLLFPDAVGPERPVGNTGRLGDLAPALQTGGVMSVSENGVLGDARKASAESGELLFAQMCERALRALASVPER